MKIEGKFFYKYKCILDIFLYNFYPVIIMNKLCRFVTHTHTQIQKVILMEKLVLNFALNLYDIQK